MAINITLPEFDVNVTVAQIETIPQSAGIYFFYDENDDLLYIGKTVNLRSRIIAHISSGEKEGLHRIKAFFVDCPMERDIYETYFINTLQPKLNTAKVWLYDSQRQIRQQPETLETKLPDVLTIQEISALAAIPQQVVKHLVESGKLKSIKIGNIWYVSKEDYLKFYEERFSYEKENTLVVEEGNLRKRKSKKPKKEQSRRAKIKQEQPQDNYEKTLIDALDSIGAIIKRAEKMSKRTA